MLKGCDFNTNIQYMHADISLPCKIMFYVFLYLSFFKKRIVNFKHKNIKKSKCVCACGGLWAWSFFHSNKKILEKRIIFQKAYILYIAAYVLSNKYLFSSGVEVNKYMCTFSVQIFNIHTYNCIPTYNYIYPHFFWLKIIRRNYWFYPLL